RGDDGDRAAHADESRGLSPLLLQGLGRPHDVGGLAVEGDALGAARVEVLGLAVLRQPLPDETLDPLQHLLGVLPRYEPAGDLHGGARGNNGLGADALIAAGDAVELHRRPRPDLLQHAVAPLAGRMPEADPAQERRLVESELGPALELLARRLLDAVIEPRDFHL